MAVNQLISKFGTIATFENERWKDRQRQGIKLLEKMENILAENCD
jgi:hypothetical protein